MKGLHLTADLYRCRCEPSWLTDAQALGAWCVQVLEAVGLPPAGHLFHGFAPGTPREGGVSVTLLLPESHVVLHTWPAQRSAAIDVYLSQGEEHSAKGRGLMVALVNRFQPEWTEQRSLDRGDGE